MKNNPVVDEWLEKFSPQIHLITHELIRVAHRNMTRTHEFIYQDAVGYSITESPYHISPRKKEYVTFGFFFGVGLPDPKKLLVRQEKRPRRIGKACAVACMEAPERVTGVHAGMKKSRA